MLRRIAERLSRGVVLRRRLPRPFQGLPIYVTPEAGLRYWGAMDNVDPLLYGMAQELVKPGSVVWDVGANVGLFSFCAAVLAGREGVVLAIEPDLWLAQLIWRSARSLRANDAPCAEVKMLCVSVSDTNRVSELEIAQSPTVTLDSLLDFFPPPSVLKIDVETHEGSVLAGATRLLKEYRPTIWCEVSQENSKQLTQLFLNAGYELYGDESQPHPRCDYAWFNTLAIPARKAA